jgi:hypothetical protein
VALHPDRPWIVFSGCYGGLVSRWNERTGQALNVMVYPQLQIGMAPKDLRERFQWNAPIVVSPHNPDVVYNASQHVWRSTDLGITWERISEDLSTNTKAHQDYAGEPITKDNTGVEVYNTVFALQVSPHNEETIWAGTDDGLVWITKDQGDNWTNITPKDLPQYGTVQNLEISKHQPGKAYIAVHRYRLDDWKPYIWKTTDYGQSWTRIADGTNGIPADYPAWVVREDPKRAGLLYAGTEFGLFVSFDDGRNWQSLQRNLPVTRIPDMKVHNNDLVVATHGRSFWILDDLTPLHELTGETAKEQVYLYSPQPAYRINPVRGGDAEDREPEGKPGIATFDYYFSEKPDSAVTLEILNAAGEVLRCFTTDSAKSKERGEKVLPVKKGHTRFHWNLLAEGVKTVGEMMLWETAGIGGVKAIPGTYRLRLAVAGGEKQTRSFEVKLDPRCTEITKEDLVKQHELALELRDSLNNIYNAIRTIRSVKEQVNSVAENAQEAGHNIPEIQQLVDKMNDELNSIETSLIQTKNESFQDPLNFPPKLKSQYAFLYNYVNSPSSSLRGPIPPTKGARERLRELNQEWEPLRGALQDILNTELKTFNEKIDAIGDPVFVPKYTD